MREILLPEQLRAEGLDPRDWARLVKREELLRLRRGAFLRPDTRPAGSDHRSRHRLLIEANLAYVSDEAVVSHWSAAVLHGLPTWDDDLAAVHLTRSRKYGGRVVPHLHVNPAPLTIEDVTTVAGITTTTLARTVVDLGRHAGPRRAVALADAALRLGLDADDLDRALAAGTRRPGIRTARRAAALADGRSESVGESYSRLTLVQLGLAPSHLQYEIRSPSGALIGRTDFCWEAERTVGEFDGRVKYDELVPENSSTRAVLYAEKRREDAIRSLGWEFVRWSWDDLSHPDRLAEALHNAFARAARQRR